MNVLKIIERTYMILCITFLVLLTASLELSLNTQIIMLLIGSFIVGLPHGAMDYDVGKFIGLCDTVSNKVTFFAVYLSIAGLNFLLWLWMPLAGFLFFIALTIWHFGEDWEVHHTLNNVLFILRKILFGAGFVCLPSVLYAGELNIILSLVIDTQHIDTLLFFMQTVGKMLILGISAFIIFDLFQKRFEKALLGLVFALSGIFLPPILFLLLYFCVFHGPRHTLELYEILNYKSFSEMLKSQIPIMILTSVLLFAVFMFYEREFAVNEAIFSSLIVLIACLTTPHMILIEYLKKITSTN